MKSMQKQAQQPNRIKEEKGPLVQIKLGVAKTSAGGEGVEGGGLKKSGFKKGGFKSAFGAVEDDDQVVVKREDDVALARAADSHTADEDVDSDVTDEEDYYDPRQPTGCMPGCGSRIIVTAG